MTGLPTYPEGRREPFLWTIPGSKGVSNNCDVGSLSRESREEGTLPDSNLSPRSRPSYYVMDRLLSPSPTTATGTSKY